MEEEKAHCQDLLKGAEAKSKTTCRYICTYRRMMFFRLIFQLDCWITLMFSLISRRMLSVIQQSALILCHPARLSWWQATRKFVCLPTSLIIPSVLNHQYTRQHQHTFILLIKSLALWEITLLSNNHHQIEKKLKKMNWVICRPWSVVELKKKEIWFGNHLRYWMIPIIISKMFLTIHYRNFSTNNWNVEQRSSVRQQCSYQMPRRTKKV